MATFSSSTAFIVLLSGVVVVAGGALQEKVKAACDSTPHPKTCSSVLSPSVNANNSADECALALLAAERASHLLFQAVEKINVYYEITNKDKGRDEQCLSDCAQKMGLASSELAGKDKFDSRYDEKMTISDLRSYIADAKAKHLVWNCDRCRSLDKVEEVAKGSTVEKFMKVLYVLVDRVPAGKEC